MVSYLCRNNGYKSFDLMEDDMRVLAGSARRLQLKTIEGMDTRPTTDRIKETLFNILQNDIEGCQFLDLYSGSGAIGIEALSRGADRAVFVENNKPAVDCIKENLAFTKLSDRAKVIANHVSSALNTLEDRHQVFDVIYMDPPYNRELEKETLMRLSDSRLLNENSVIIVEAALETDFSYVIDMGYLVVKEKLYKTNKHIFLKKLVYMMGTQM